MAHTVSTGIQPLDDRIGGLPEASLVQVHGPAGSGKSSLALTVAREARPSCLVLAERLHRHRVTTVLQSGADRVLVARPRDLDEQDEAVGKACKLLARSRIEVVVLDSLTFLYRFTRGSSKEALSRLFDQLGRMHDAARKGGGVALFTNQVRGTGDDRRPIGGPGVRHVSDVILALEPSEGAWRTLRVEKHPYEAAGARVDVKITQRGIE